MKKILLFALVIAITSAFAFAAVQAPTAGLAASAGYACPNVGWNTRACAAYMQEAPVQPLAFLVRPPITPNVGWNT
jgi:hypothetical protein